MRFDCFRYSAVLVLLFMASIMSAMVKPAHIFADHAVLQRDMPIKIWGTADSYEFITIQFHGQAKTVKADGVGHWMVSLDKEAAGGPYKMTISGNTNTVVLVDIYVGEVWICSGQSNMEWTVSQAQYADYEIEKANFKLIRHIKIEKTASLTPEPDIKPANWDICSQTTAGNFSAVAYFFARKIHRETGMAVGLINASWGGTDCETWMSKDALETNEHLKETIKRLPASKEEWERQQKQKVNALIEQFQGKAVDNDWIAACKERFYNDSAWPTLQVPQEWEEQGLPDFDGVGWMRKQVVLTELQAAISTVLSLGTIDDCDSTFVNGQLIGHTCGWDIARNYTVPTGLLKPGKNIIVVKVTDTGGGGGFYGDPSVPLLIASTGTISLAGSWRTRVEKPTISSPNPNALPTLLYNGMISPIIGYGIRGVIWYQGENNVGRAADYAKTFPALIADWRKQLNQGDFPFYYVQLAAFLPLDQNVLYGSSWAELRNAQLQTLALPNTGMAVATDIGDALDIHPRNKQDVGQRLALLALKNTYGQKVVCNGPIYQSMEIKGSNIMLSFDPLGGQVLKAGLPEDDLRGFIIAGADGKFYEAVATIVGSKIMVSSNAVSAPVAVRFGWFDNPSRSNLTNKEGLPASPFRTDSWPLITEGNRY
jgi:sialate O-acetylesterase